MSILKVYNPIDIEVDHGDGVYLYDKDGTRWSIGYVPIGGYVKTLGAEDYHLSQQEIDEKYSKEDQNFLINNKKYYQKVLYALGGPLANFLSAILVFSLMVLKILICL